MTVSASKVPETAQISIAGRMVTVRRPNETQIALMHRQGIITSQALQRAIALQEAAEEIEDPVAREAAEGNADPHFRTGLDATAEIMEIMEYLLDEEDRDFVHDQMKRGTVQITDLFDAFDAFKPKGRKSAPKKAKRLPN